MTPRAKLLALAALTVAAWWVAIAMGYGLVRLVQWCWP